MTPGTWLLLEDFLSASVSALRSGLPQLVGFWLNTPFFSLLKSVCRAAPPWQARVPGWDLAHSCKRGCSCSRGVHPAQDSAPCMAMNQCCTRKYPRPQWVMQEGKQGSAGDQEKERREGDCNRGDKPKCHPGRNDSFLILKESASLKCSQ